MLEVAFFHKGLLEHAVMFNSRVAFCSLATSGHVAEAGQDRARVVEDGGSVQNRVARALQRVQISGQA